MKCEKKTCNVCGFTLDKYGRCPDDARTKQEHIQQAVRTLLADGEFILTMARNRYEGDRNKPAMCVNCKTKQDARDMLE